MHAYLLPVLDFGPIVIQRLVALLPEPEYDLVLIDGRFTPREIVAHLADWEPIMRARIQAAVESPGSAVQGYDEGKMAIEHGYAQSDIHDQASLFRVEREKTTAYINGLTAEELKRTVTHSERGVQSVEDMAGTLIGHDLYHIEQLTAYLAAG